MNTFFNIIGIAHFFFFNPMGQIELLSINKKSYSLSSQPQLIPTSMFSFRCILNILKFTFVTINIEINNSDSRIEKF